VKRRIRKFIPIGVIIVVIALFVFPSIASQKTSSIPNGAEKVLIAHVIDGDTIQLDDDKKVRLVGVKERGYTPYSVCNPPQ